MMDFLENLAVVLLVGFLLLILGSVAVLTASAAWEVSHCEHYEHCIFPEDDNYAP